jgi:hypothetical protein
MLDDVALATGTSYPAAIRSSRTELFKEPKHHCPKGESSRSRKSGFTQCRANFLSVNMARTRGRLAIKKAGDLTKLPNKSRASLIISWHAGSAGSGGSRSGAPSHSWHLGFVMAESVQVALRWPDAPQGTNPRSSIALHLFPSSNAAKLALRCVLED